MPNIVLRLLEFGEKECQRELGKGFSDRTFKTEVRAAGRFLPSSNAIVLDVGANRGDWTRRLLRDFGTRIDKVYAFEPSRHNRSHIEAIGDARVVLVPKAVSDHAGSATLYSNQEGSGLASLTQRQLGFR